MRESGGEEEREDDAEELELRLRVRERFWDAETEETVRVVAQLAFMEAARDSASPTRLTRSTKFRTQLVAC